MGTGTRFNLQFSNLSEITETVDKLRWYRYRKALLPREATDYIGVDLSTYIHYKNGRDFYPKEHMEKPADMFETPPEDLPDEYNLFLYGQWEEISSLRVQRGLTQK